MDKPFPVCLPERPFREEFERCLVALRSCTLQETERLSVAIYELEAELRGLASGAADRPLSPRGAVTNCPRVMQGPVEPEKPQPQKPKPSVNSSSSVPDHRLDSLSSLAVENVSTEPRERFDTDAGTDDELRPSYNDNACTASYPAMRLNSAKSRRRFEVCSVWQETPSLEGFTPAVLMKLRSNALGTPASRRSSIDKQERAMMERAKMEKNSGGAPVQVFVEKYFMLNPLSLNVVAWDMLFIVLILYEVVTIPLQAFNPSKTRFTSAMSWISRIFWTIAIPRSFITGYVRRDGVVIVDARQATWNYITTWFFFDLLVVAGDWTEAAIEGTTMLQSMRLVRLTRTLRVVKVMNLGRKMRVPEFITGFFTRPHYLWLMIKVSRMVILIIGLSHFLACFWYAIADEGSSRGMKNWTENVEEQSVMHLYLLSLLWAISQLTGNGASITMPQNDLELTFTVLVSIIFYVMMLSLASSLTNTLVDVTISTGESILHFPILRKYLRQHGISSELGERVMQAAQLAIAQKKQNIPESEVRLLKDVSKPLLMEIRYQVHGHVIVGHPFFREYSSIDMMALQSICRVAISELLLSAGDVLFTEGEKPPAPRMLFVKNGSLVYSSATMQKFRRVQSGDWVSEMVLWVNNWLHLGSLCVTPSSWCTAVALDAISFQKTVTSFSVTSVYARKYASRLMNVLNELSETSQRDTAPIDDVDTVGLDLEAIAAAAFHKKILKEEE